MELMHLAFEIGGSLLLVTIVWLLLMPVTASAHCDTMVGPTATDGINALETGNINYALKWIGPDAGKEAELKEGFDLVLKVYRQGGDAREVAKRYFIDLLVRIHRSGEGAPHVGVRPHGIPLDPKVAAADRCIADGTIDHLKGLVPEDLLPELEDRLKAALALKNYDVDDVPAARAYVKAYVRFFHLAEEDSPGHAHGPHSQDQGHHRDDSHHHSH